MKISSSLGKVLTVLAIGFVALASTASADVLLVNTLGIPTQDPGSDYNFTSPLSTGKLVAQQFKTVPVTGFTRYNITGVSVNMYRAATGTGLLNLDLYSNVDGTAVNNSKDTPGTLVANLGSFAISSIDTTSSNLVTASNLVVPTSSNTIYWIVASVTGGTGSVGFNTTTTNMSFNAPKFSGFTPIASWINPSGGQNSWYIDGPTDGAYNNNPLAMSVTVPEPSTYALGAMSAIALGAIGRRKRLAKTVEQASAPETSV